LRPGSTLEWAVPKGRRNPMPSDLSESRNLMSRPFRILCCTALLLAAMVVPAKAEFLVRQVNLAYLAQRADIIVQGRVIQARYEGLPNYPHINSVLVTLEVERMFRGPEGGQYTFRQFLLPSQMRGGGKNLYRVGQRLLLFLPAPSQYGLSSPIGHEQGRFHISRNMAGADVIANEFGNAGIFRNVSADAEKFGAGLSHAQSQVVAAPRGPVALSDLVSLVNHLMLLPRIQ